MNTYTEQQARTKWCPFARIRGAGDYLISTNGEQQVPAFEDDHSKLTRCLASGCMLWRWVDDTKPDQGYCGLAPRQ